MTVGRKLLVGAVALSGMLAAVPASADVQAGDVKAGVDAWAKGDYPRAITEWRPLAVAGDADAQFNLAQAYKLGRGVPLDPALAESWFRKAALQGHVQAADNYGLALFQAGKKTDALPWLQKSVAHGEPRAQLVLGTMLFNGDAVSRDFPRAYALMTRASAGAAIRLAGAGADGPVYIADRPREGHCAGPAICGAVDAPGAGRGTGPGDGSCGDRADAGGAITDRRHASPVQTAAEFASCARSRAYAGAGTREAGTVQACACAFDGQLAGTARGVPGSGQCGDAVEQSSRQAARCTALLREGQRRHAAPGRRLRVEGGRYAGLFGGGRAVRDRCALTGCSGTRYLWRGCANVLSDPGAGVRVTDLHRDQAAMPRLSDRGQRERMFDGRHRLPADAPHLRASRACEDCGTSGPQRRRAGALTVGQ
jgi:TPR repeat protein